MMSRVDVTVGICTWNRSKLLDQTLEAMAGMIIPAGITWELLIVNNNCTDDTDDVAARHSAHLPIRLIHEPRKGKCNAANTALDATRGALLLWTDDDVLVPETWLGSLVDAAARHPEIGGFAGPIDPWFPTEPDPDLVEAFPQLKRGFCGIDHGPDEVILADKALIVGANMAFRMDAVRGLRFDPAIGPSPRKIGRPGREVTLSMGGGDEDDYVRKFRAIGGRIAWIPSMRLRHYVDPGRMTLDYLRALHPEYGRLLVRSEGVPGGPQMFGVPRWLLRAWLEAKVRAILPKPGARRVALENLRQALFYAGMIRECRAIHQAGTARTSG
jgi:glycosyltransferase involved in cell wall biosynthesis